MSPNKNELKKITEAAREKINPTENTTPKEAEPTADKQEAEPTEEEKKEQTPEVKNEEVVAEAEEKKKSIVEIITRLKERGSQLLKETSGGNTSEEDREETAANIKLNEVRAEATGQVSEKDIDEVVEASKAEEPPSTEPEEEITVDGLEAEFPDKAEPTDGKPEPELSPDAENRIQIVKAKARAEKRRFQDLGEKKEPEPAEKSPSEEQPTETTTPEELIAPTTDAESEIITAEGLEAESPDEGKPAETKPETVEQPKLYSIKITEIDPNRIDDFTNLLLANGFDQDEAEKVAKNIVDGGSLGLNVEKEYMNEWMKSLNDAGATVDPVETVEGLEAESPDETEPTGEEDATEKQKSSSEEESTEQPTNTEEKTEPTEQEQVEKSANERIVRITGVDDDSVDNLVKKLWGWGNIELDKEEDGAKIAQDIEKIAQSIVDGNSFDITIRGESEKSFKNLLEEFKDDGITVEEVLTKKEIEEQNEKIRKQIKNKEIKKQVVKTVAGTIASVIGVKSLYDVPAYLKQRFMVRGMFGKGKGLEGSIDELFEASKKKRPKRVKEENIGKNTEVQKSIKDLNKRLKLTKEGTQKGSEQRKKIAVLLKEHRRIAREEKEYTEQDKTERHDKIKEILDDYTTTKVTGMQAVRETLNTFFVVAGAYGLRGVSYALTDGAGRWQKLRKEARIKAKEESKLVVDTEVVPEKVKIIKDVIVGAVTETFKNAIGKSKAEGKTQKGIATVKAWGQIARYAGMVAMGINTESTSDSIENALDGLSGKVKLGGAVRNFQENLHRTTIGRITSVKRIANVLKGKTEITAPMIAAKSGQKIEVETAQDTSESKRTPEEYKSIMEKIRKQSGEPSTETSVDNTPKQSDDIETGDSTSQPTDTDIELPMRPDIVKRGNIMDEDLLRQPQEKSRLSSQADIMPDHAGHIEPPPEIANYTYKGGKSAWGASKKITEELGGKIFENLQEGEKTYFYDKMKDTVIEQLEGKGINPDKVTETQLKDLDWNKIVAEFKQEGGLDIELSEAQIQNIESNNASLKEFFEKNPKAPRTIENYEKALKGDGDTGEILESKQNIVEKTQPRGIETSEEAPKIELSLEKQTPKIPTETPAESYIAPSRTSGKADTLTGLEAPTLEEVTANTEKLSDNDLIAEYDKYNGDEKISKIMLTMIEKRVHKNQPLLPKMENYSEIIKDGTFNKNDRHGLVSAHDGLFDRLIELKNQKDINILEKVEMREIHDTLKELPKLNNQVDFKPGLLKPKFEFLVPKSLKEIRPQTDFSDITPVKMLTTHPLNETLPINNIEIIKRGEQLYTTNNGQETRITKVKSNNDGIYYDKLGRIYNESGEPLLYHEGMGYKSEKTGRQYLNVLKDGRINKSYTAMPPTMQKNLLNYNANAIGMPTEHHEMQPEVGEMHEIDHTGDENKIINKQGESYIEDSGGRTYLTKNQEINLYYDNEGKLYSTSGKPLEFVPGKGYHLPNTNTYYNAGQHDGIFKANSFDTPQEQLPTKKINHEAMSHPEMNQSNISEDDTDVYYDRNADGTIKALNFNDTPKEHRTKKPSVNEAMSHPEMNQSNISEDDIKMYKTDILKEYLNKEETITGQDAEKLWEDVYTSKKDLATIERLREELPTKATEKDIKDITKEIENTSQRIQDTAKKINSPKSTKIRNTLKTTIEQLEKESQHLNKKDKTRLHLLRNIFVGIKK